MNNYIDSKNIKNYSRIIAKKLKLKNKNFFCKFQEMRITIQKYREENENRIC